MGPSLCSANELPTSGPPGESRRHRPGHVDGPLRRRRDFEALGGYDRSLRFAEDLHFYWRLKRLGARRGESFVRLRSFKALGSTRKFDQHGDWHYFAMLMKAPLYLTLRRRSMDAFADECWYSGKRTAPRELPEVRRP